MRHFQRGYALVHLDRLEANIKALKANVKVGTKVYGAVKADGYGHGILAVAHALEAHVDGFATATIWEALKLKNDGIEKPMLVLGVCYEGTEADCILHQVRCSVTSYEDAKRLSQTAEKLGKKAYVHIKVDTGMGRLGLLWSPVVQDEIVRIYNLPGIIVEGLFTHFAASDEFQKDSAKEQLAKFKATITALEMMGIKIPICHCANSGAIIDMPETAMDAIRPGIAMYGLYPSDEVDKAAVKLQPVLEWKSQVVSIKMIPAKQGISYGSTYVTTKETKVAVVPVGYGDGYPRSLSNQGYVLIAGKKVPILGRICMDQFMVDVSDITDIRLGDEVTLIGEDGDLSITVEEICELSGGFHYEFLCDIGKRIKRAYIGKLEGEKQP